MATLLVRDMTPNGTSWRLFSIVIYPNRDNEAQVQNVCDHNDRYWDILIWPRMGLYVNAITS